MRILLTLGLLGCTSGLALNTAALVPSPSGARPELLRRFSASTYQEVLRPARNLIPGLFSYVDCRPFDELTTEGRWFLATNLAFMATGGAMAMEGGSPGLGVCFELAGTCLATGSNRTAAARTLTPKPNDARSSVRRFSTFYHWAQLRLGGTSHPFVQLALLFDYMCAFPTIGGGLAYAATAVSAGAHLPLGAVVCGVGAGVAFVVACLPVCHKPRRYMLVHGLWHVLGAASAFILATSADVVR